MTDAQIAALVAKRDKLTNRRDALTDSKRVAAIDRQLSQVEPGRNNAVDLLLHRDCAILPPRPEYGLTTAREQLAKQQRESFPDEQILAHWPLSSAACQIRRESMTVAQAEQQRVIDETASAAECSVIEYADYQEALRLTYTEKQDIETYALGHRRRGPDRTPDNPLMDTVIDTRCEWMKPQPESCKRDALHEYSAALKAWRETRTA